MDSKYTTLFRTWLLVLLTTGAAFGQPAGAPRTMAPVVAAPAALKVTILTAVGGERHVARVGKEHVAVAVLDALQPLWEKERDHRAFRTDPARTAGV